MKFKISFRCLSGIILFLFAGAVAFFLLTMPQTGLFLDFIKHSSRINGFDYNLAAKTSMPYKGLWGFILPAGIKGININYLADWVDYALGKINFFSITVIFLLFLSFFYPKNKLYTFSIATCIFSILLALGKNTPLHSWFFIFIPFFNTLRHPGFAITMLIIPLSIIVAFSVEHIKSLSPIQLSLFNKPSLFSRTGNYFSRTFTRRLLSVFVFLLLVLIFITLNNKTILRVYNLDIHALLRFIYGYLFFLLILGINILFFSLKERRNISCDFYVFLLVFLIFTELFYFISGINPVINEQIYKTRELSLNTAGVIKTSNYKFIHTPAAASNTVRKGRTVFDAHRKFLLSIPSNTGMLHRLYDAGGYDAITLKSYSEFLSSALAGNKILDTQKLNILNVKYIITLQDIDNKQYDKIPMEGDVKIYKNQQALPVFFVSKDKNDLNLLMSQSSWSRKNEYDFMLYKTNVNLNEDGYLVFSNNYYPGWKVYVDNKKAEMEKCFGIYMGVKVKKGIHNVIFRYSPVNLRLFIALNTAAAAGFIILGIMWVVFPVKKNRY